MTLNLLLIYLSVVTFITLSYKLSNEIISENSQLQKDVLTIVFFLHPICNSTCFLSKRSRLRSYVTICYMIILLLDINHHDAIKSNQSPLSLFLGHYSLWNVPYVTRASSWTCPGESSTIIYQMVVCRRRWAGLKSNTHAWP